MTTLTKDLKVRYEEEVKESLKSQFGYENVFVAMSGYREN